MKTYKEKTRYHIHRNHLKPTSMTRYLPGSRAIFVNSSPSSAKLGRQPGSTIQPGKHHDNSYERSAVSL